MDFNNAQADLKKAKEREQKATHEAQNVNDRVAQATAQEEKASNDSQRLKAQEIKYKASGDVRVAEVKANAMKLQRAKAETERNYRVS